MKKETALNGISMKMPTTGKGREVIFTKQAFFAVTIKHHLFVWGKGYSCMNATPEKPSL